MLDRLELMLTQISTIEEQRDAVLEHAAHHERAAAIIGRLANLRGVGPLLEAIPAR